MGHLLDGLEKIPMLLPLAIMCMRISDVSISTMRMIMIIRGKRLIAASLGFFEVLIWLAAITGIISHLNNWLNVIFYGIGFSLGNVTGMYIESKMAVGQQVLRFISRNEGDRIISSLRDKGQGVTQVQATGRDGPVGLGFMIAARKKVPRIIDTITEIDPAAVITVEDVRHSNIVDYYQHGQIGTRWWNNFLKKK
ncbi:DUF5698 domain-containing protein [bacterium]|nr:DUF5698 domain-containing protein [bacterium]